MYQYFLHFTAPVHFGLEGIGQERIEERVRSDTLWGAIIQQWLLLYEEDPDWLCQEPPFQVSSSFPLIAGNAYFPMPIGALDKLVAEVAAMEGPVQVKDLKKIRYLSQSLFQKVAAGYRPTLEDVLVPGAVFPFLDAGNKQEKAFCVEQRPRLETDQLCGGGQEGAFFYCADQYFFDKSGLWFLADFDSSEARQRFEASLRLLGDNGLGADRSVGRGQFDFSCAKFSPQDKGKTAAYLLLFLYHPTESEVKEGILEAPCSAYSLIKRSGHAGSVKTARFRRSDVWMIEEGAVLPFMPSGDIPLVLQKTERIPHNVYRCGRAFCLSLQSGWLREVRP